jgi:hypothetical protein
MAIASEHLYEVFWFHTRETTQMLLDYVVASECGLSPLQFSLDSV